MYRNISNVGSVQQVGSFTNLGAWYFYLYFAGILTLLWLLQGNMLWRELQSLVFVFVVQYLCCNIFPGSDALLLTLCPTPQNTHQKELSASCSECWAVLEPSREGYWVSGRGSPAPGGREDLKRGGSGQDCWDWGFKRADKRNRGRKELVTGFCQSRRKAGAAADLCTAHCWAQNR